MDELAGNLGIDLREGPGEYLIASGTWFSRTILLIQPTTYMNNSGFAVREVVDRFSVPLEEMLVVLDDVSLRLGLIRLRQGGSDGGHNGLASVIEQLGSEEIPRLRCGIGKGTTEASPVDLVSFVLSRFDRSEIDEVEAMIHRASEVALAVAADGLGSAMTQYNTKNI